MQSLSRGLAFMVVVTAVLVFSASLVAVVAVWIANTPITNAVLTTLNPMITTLKTAEAAIGDVDQGLGNIRGIVENLKAFLESAGLIKELLPGVVESVVNIANSLGNLQATLADSGIKLVDARAILENIESSVVYWIDLASVFLTILFLWIAFSQVSLFIHGWFYFSGKDLLANRAVFADIPTNDPDQIDNDV